MKFVSREQWGAKYAAGTGAREIPTAEVWLHHTVTLAPDLAFADLNKDSVDDDEAAAMRTIERIGQQRFGAGFSYNLALMPSGRAYVGCGVRRVGTHTSKRNTRALGIVLVGDYEKNVVPEPMRASLVEVLRFGFAEGWIDRPAIDGGHRDLKETACPGRHAYKLIGDVTREASGVRPKPNPTPEPGQAGGKMYAVYTGTDGNDWGTDMVTRQPFDDRDGRSGQERKAMWIDLVQRSTRTKVVRIELSEAEQELLVPINIGETNEPAPVEPQPEQEPTI